GAMARVPIPATEDPGVSWDLRATARYSSVEQQIASIALLPREETPGEPRVDIRWTPTAVAAGDRATFRATVRDANDKPVTGASLRYWVGQDGVAPPEEADEWEKISKLAVTDLTGSIAQAVDTPRVVTRLGTRMTVVVRTNVGGRDLRKT